MRRYAGALQFGAFNGGLDRGLFCLGLSVTDGGCFRALGFYRKFIGAYFFLAFQALQVKFMSFTRLVGLLLVALARPDFAFGEALVLHQRDVAWAHVIAAAAFDAIEQIICLRLAEFAPAREPVQILRLQVSRTSLRA